MTKKRVVTLKADADCAWIAVLDAASGLRGRYTVYRVHCWASKRADIVGREVDLTTARKLARTHVDKNAPAEMPESKPDLDHTCDWRKAAIKLAACVAATLQTGGKIGMGSGMLMKVVDGKKTIERWDKDFIEALDFIGIEVTKTDKKKPRSKPGKAA